MPAKRRLTMRAIRHILRLHASGESDRSIGRSVGAARSTVQDTLKGVIAESSRNPTLSRFEER
ncbi:hypothetical protein MicloDRAFT_00000380 [Microvirga lotononidis]|uniref:Homeodomain-like domain-containing protein n=1 Tax=Microvirga lotononidis TaxID=864069 RepID=I4Z4A9_9HYPH|nr:hypothetical protein MicloDRAFT_00000380 [Microvirga lotononidis]